MKAQNYFQEAYGNFKGWFLEKEHPHSKLNKNVFIHDVLKFTGLVLVFLILYNNVGKLNQINLWVIQLGSILLLVSLFFVVRKAWHLVVNLKYWFRGFNHGTKLLIGLFIVLLLLMAYFNQENVISKVTTSYEQIAFGSFNPVNLKSLNLTFSGLNLSKSSLVNNPYPSVSLRELSQNPSVYANKNISVAGDLVWRMGGYSLNSGDGYWIWIEDNCKEGQRNYNDGLSAPSGRYSAKGVFLPPTPKDQWGFGFGMEYNWRLSCVTPLE